MDENRIDMTKFTRSYLLVSGLATFSLLSCSLPGRIESSSLNDPLPVVSIELRSPVKISTHDGKGNPEYFVWREALRDSIPWIEVKLQTPLVVVRNQ